MHLVVDADWAKAHPRRAAKIQVAYLVRLARKRSQSSTGGAEGSAGDTLRTQRKGLTEAVRSA
jgi:hypothetical protein